MKGIEKKVLTFKKHRRILVLNAKGDLMKLICAWCQTLIKDGEEPASHGICEECYQHQITMLAWWHGLWLLNKESYGGE